MDEAAALLDAPRRKTVIHRVILFDSVQHFGVCYKSLKDSAIFY